MEMGDIGFFFKYGSQVVQLPVNPEEISVDYQGNNDTVEIIQLGDINILKDRKLGVISFSCWFPYLDWFPAVRTKGEFKSQQFYKDFFEGIQKDKKECRFIVTGIDINMLVSIESFKYKHKAGEHEDAYYDIELKEYKPYSIGVMDFSNNKTTSNKAKAGDKKTSTSATTSPAPSKITIGCSVILNGTVHVNSAGSKPGKTFKNYKGKINLINKAGSYPYHVTTLDGGWLGWVNKGSVKLI